jgi:hypothetical protein
MFRNEFVFDNYDYAFGGLRALGVTAGVCTRGR